MENPNLILQSTASFLLAAAVVELFPDVQISGGQGTEKYFYRDFVFPFEFNPEFLPLIEERMRLIVREKRAVRLTEMMTGNAASLMQHRQQSLLAQQLLNTRQATLPMVQIGDFIIPHAQPILDELAIPHLKILECYPLNQKRSVRIVGAAALDKDKLKQIAKEPSVGSRSHQKVASEMALFCAAEEEGQWVWRPKGERLRHLLLELWRNEMSGQNFNLICSSMPHNGNGNGDELLLAYAKRFQASKVAESSWFSNDEYADSNDGLLSPKSYFDDRALLFCTEEKLLEECISSLRFILKIPKILGFEFEIVLLVSSEGAHKTKAKKAAILRQALEEAGLNYSVEKQTRPGKYAGIDVRFADSLGRKWTGPALSLPDTRKLTAECPLLAISLLGPLERMCALLLEKDEGWLPFWLAPEQVRILVASHQKGVFANEVEETLKSRGIRTTTVAGEGKLKACLFQAFLEKVPFILLLGDKEERTKTVAFRAYGEREERRLSLEDFCAKLRAVNTKLEADNIGMMSGNSEFKN